MATSTESAFGGESDLDQIMLLLEKEDRILVATDHGFKPHVRSAIQREKIKHTDRVFEIVYVSMEEIAKRRAAGQGESLDVARSESEMQRAATDLFKKAVTYQASDIHIRIHLKGRTQILFRVHKDLSVVEQHLSSWGQALCSTIYHSLADISEANFEPQSRQDARIGTKDVLPEGLEGIRIATTPSVNGYVMVMRLLYDATDASDDVSELGYSKTQRARVQILKRRPTGLNVICGPTGSGKSTTLQRTLLSLIRETQGRKHVITVEDPPEYPIEGAVQTPVTNADSEQARSIAFQQAIKGAMRLDPDVIMIGEIRDTPSAKLALQAAMTGHQVWTTLHGNGAFHIIDRMVDLGVPLNMISDESVLSGMICQRLLKTLCPSCKRPFSMSEKHEHEGNDSYEQDVLRYRSMARPDEMFITGAGCKACRQTGTIGRIAVAEVVVTDRTMMGYIRKGDIHSAIEYWQREQKGLTMVEHAVRRIKQGLVDPFETEAEVGLLDGGKSMFSYQHEGERATDGH